MCEVLFQMVSKMRLKLFYKTDFINNILLNSLIPFISQGGTKAKNNYYEMTSFSTRLHSTDKHDTEGYPIKTYAPNHGCGGTTSLLPYIAIQTPTRGYNFIIVTLHTIHLPASPLPPPHHATKRFERQFLRSLAQASANHGNGNN